MQVFIVLSSLKANCISLLRFDKCYLFFSFLFLQEYGKNLKELGVVPEDILAYNSLLECVSQSKA